MDLKGRGVRALVLGYERKNFGTPFWPLGTPVRAPGEPPKSGLRERQERPLRRAKRGAVMSIILIFESSPSILPKLITASSNTGH